VIRRHSNYAPVKQDQNVNIPQIAALRLPAMHLTSTAGGICELTELPHALLIFVPFVLPQGELPGRPWQGDESASAGLEELLAFARLYEQFESRDIRLFGITTQSPLVQKLVVEILALPFPLLSDSRRTLCQQLQLPTTNRGRIPRNRPIIIEVRNGSVAYVWDPLAWSGQCATLILRHVSNDVGRD
jgi:peroxiredoxin